MLLEELFDWSDSDDLFEGATMIWARQKSKTGDKVVRKYRCTSGRKIGRIVSSPTACGSTLDVKRSLRSSVLQKTHGKRKARKSLLTKRKNPASKRVARLNKGK